MVGVGMVWQSWHQFLRSNPLPCVFLSAVEFEPFLHWSEAYPSVSPALRSRLSSRGLEVCVCACVWVGNRGFPVGLHTKHSWLPDGRLVGQVHAAGSRIRSSVFVWAEQYPTHMHTHADTQKHTHIPRAHTSPQLCSEWQMAARCVYGQFACICLWGWIVVFIKALKWPSKRETHTSLDVGTGIHAQEKHITETHSQRTTVSSSLTGTTWYLSSFVRFGERKHGRGEKKREREEVILPLMATVQPVAWLLLWLLFKQGVSEQRMCMLEQKAEWDSSGIEHKTKRKKKRIDERIWAVRSRTKAALSLRKRDAKGFWPRGTPSKAGWAGEKQKERLREKVHDRMWL